MMPHLTQTCTCCPPVVHENHNPCCCCAQMLVIRLQVLASIATINNIKYRTVLLRMLHNGGTLASCQRAAIARDKAVLQHLKLNTAQARLASEAENRLRGLGL